MDLKSESTTSGNNVPSLVMQKNARGCGLAVFAMLTGRTYDEALSVIPFPNIFGDWDKEGINHESLDHALAGEGYAMARRWKHGAMNKKTVPWPPEPWAQVHLCNVIVYQNSPGSHFVVMLEDGSVLDPALGDGRRLSDYHDVCWVAAVVKVNSGRM